MTPNNPLVAIQCIVYNHEPYLRDCLEGFVMQQTDFPFVAIVHDDASTDGSAAIIREYEEKYPDMIKPIYETENQYSKGNGIVTRIMNASIEATIAKYVAMCEGDDYWTDPLKLQKQVDFMESHPEYSLCFTNAKIRFNNFEGVTINHIWDTYTIEDVIINNALNVSKRGDRIITCGHTSTILYRASCLPLPSWTTKCFVGDEPLFIALAQYGKAKFLNEITSVYRDGVGVSSKDYDEEEYWKNRIKMYKIMNQGMEYRYNAIIKPIIAASYFTLSKLVWKVGKIEKKRDAIVYLCKTLLIHPNVIIKWVVTKIKQE